MRETTANSPEFGHFCNFRKLQLVTYRRHSFVLINFDTLNDASPETIPIRVGECSHALSVGRGPRNPYHNILFPILKKGN